VQKNFDIFISPTREDQAWTRDLVKALKEHGLRVWYDAAEVKAGELWEERLREGLESSRNVVFVLGKNAATSSWVGFMTGAAMSSNKPMIPIAPIDAGAADIPVLLRKFRVIPKTAPQIAAEEVAQAVSMKSGV